MWDVDGPARRIDTRAPQCFVDEEVAQPGDARLVHEDGLDRRGPCTEGAVQLLETERERVGAEARLVGFDLDRAEPSRVAQEEVAAVGKVHAKAMPRSDSAVARVDEWIAGFFVVDEHASAHAEVHTDRGTFGVEQDQLAASPRRREAVTEQRVADRQRRRAALQEPRVGRVDTRDLPAERARLEHPTRGFDLDDLRHRKLSVNVSDVGDGAGFGALGEAGILGKEAARVPRFRDLPLATPARQFSTVDDQIDGVRARVDDDAIAFRDERDRTAVDGLRRDVTDAEAMRSA